jgi:hypothetical protein
MANIKRRTFILFTSKENREKAIDFLLNLNQIKFFGIGQ